MAAGWFTIVVLLLGSVLEAFSTNLPLQTEELWQESSEIRISPSFCLPVVLRTSTSTQTITVQQPGHIQHSTRQTSSVQPVISSTKYPASKVPEDKQETPDVQTRTTVSLHPTSFSRAVSSSSRPSRLSTSRRDHDNAIFGVLSIVREPVPKPPPTTIFKTKQDPTASRFVSVDLTSKSNLIPEFRTSIMDTMTLIANLNVDPSSPSTSGALVFDLETSSLDSFENVTSTSKKSTWAVSHHSMSDSDPRMGVGTDQGTAGTATVQLSPFKGDSRPQSTSTWCTYRPLFQCQTPSDATVSETRKATPISYPQPLLIMSTYTKPLNTPLSSARVLLYHSGEQPMGTNEAKGNYIVLINSDHLDSLSEGSLPRYTISIPSPDRENNRLTGSDNPQPSTTLNSSSMASVTTWSDAGFVDHQTASTTLDVSNGPSRTPKSTDTATATSVRSGSVIDGLRRARTISRRSLGMSVSAAVGGTTIFLLMFVLHRPFYRWICRRRTGMIWIGHASAASRSHHTEPRSPPMQYPEISHFSDDSEADYTKAHRA
ncbi:uncharacterized protein AKAW2_50404A [Aspergillus luchuensis]|uniref:Mucin family signaling protein Msb2 n=1 Tax=Aspergillus kawachii TaxID=1069201 RepID=A0A7R7WBT1_ASPKA|nr:uncharacterized protein AKAW2_50404A [Aspergillus luchuensis]BCS00063.1 hypothetical protein AKAW2_50404A [Aspergillus luchuensis]